MIKIFRQIRQRLLTENKFSKYLVYAIGEVLLVVIGILIALSINNRNDDLKHEKRLCKIHERVILDMDKDISFMKQTLDHLERNKWIFNRVIHDSISVELLDSGLTRILAGIYHTSFNTSGVNQLREESTKDSTSMDIVEAYDQMMTRFITPTEDRITKEGDNLVEGFRDNYDWYPEWMSKRIDSQNSSPELQAYFLTSQEFKHYVIWNYNWMYRNYASALERYIAILEELKTELELKVKTG